MIETYAKTASQVLAGNVSLEAAANWIVKHENEPAIDQMPLLPVSSEKPKTLKPSIAQEEIKQKPQELREPRQKKEAEDKQTEKEGEKAIMGKKVKKKARSGQKEKRGPSTSPKPVPQQGMSNAEIADGVSGIKDRELCPHIDRGINVDKLSAKLGSTESIKCEDCRGNVADRRAKKGKGKHGKKGGTNSKSESKAIWICLECGHFSCGGVGLPTTPQSHAVRHAKQNHHPLVVHYENHQLLWCFPCNKLIPAEKSDDRHKEVLNEVVKILKGQPGEGSAVDVEELWFGSGSVTSSVKSDYSVNTVANGRAGFSIRGLVNMGNTCFFNSIMQNLLALNSLRDYFIKLDESVGPLSASLRKHFLETSAEAGLRSAINPRSLFGSLCTKAPQFRGYQQHDSHELLRCLLDGLSTEELSARKHTKPSQAPVTDPTFVDAIFGGQLSSTVSCLECGHSSTIYEPFLDLSLPVPTKKPPARRIQHVTRGKKPKLPPKRSGRSLSKISKEANNLPRGSASDHSTGSNSLGEVQSIAQPVQRFVPLPGDNALSDSTDSNNISLDTAFTGDNACSDSTDPNTIAVDMGFTADDLSAVQKPRNHEVVENVGEQSTSLDSCAWLDYLEPTPVPHDIDIAPEGDEIPGLQGFSSEDVLQNDVSLSLALDASIGSSLANVIATTSLGNVEHYNVDPVVLAQQIAFSQFEDKQNVKPQLNARDIPDGSKQNIKPELNQRDIPEGSSTEGVVQLGADMGHSLDSCNQVCSKDSNNSGRHGENTSQIVDSGLALRPDKEDASASVEISSAAVGNEQDSLDFDGFGDLFNEPEVSCELKPSDNPVSETSGIPKNGVTGNSSESEPDEVDDADAPVSVESCLAFFTKPELLSKDEHAWQCDNCSKILRERRTKSRRKSQMPISEIMSNGCEDGSPSGLIDVGKNCNEVQSINEVLEKDVMDPSEGTSPPQSREIYENGKCMFQKHPETNVNVIGVQPEDTEPQTINACHGPSECSSYQNPSPCIGGCESDKDGCAESSVLSAKCESELSEQEEAESKDLKVKRDATKSVLINKAPSILTIHLKRFSQDARGRLSKLNGHVNFRETIDLKPYLDPRCADRDVFKYRLVGVVEHLGTMRGGHYVAYVRGAKSHGDCVWYHASDAYVREASLEEVMRCEAYILFYEGAWWGSNIRIRIFPNRRVPAQRVMISRPL